jgi:hypothetical protein
LRRSIGAVTSLARVRTPDGSRFTGPEGPATGALADVPLALAVPARSARTGPAGAATPLQRQRTGADATQSEGPAGGVEETRRGEGESAPAPGLDALADQVWRKLMRRLATERERRGLLPWV